MLATTYGWETESDAFSIGTRNRLMAGLLGSLLSNNSRHAAGTYIALMKETIHISSNCLSKGKSTQSTVPSPPRPEINSGDGNNTMPGSLSHLARELQVAMDIRGYGLPIHPDSSAYSRAHGRIQLDRQGSCEDDGRDYYSIRNLSLSDDPYPEKTMVSPWSGFSKKPRGYRSRSPGSNHHESKKPSATPPMPQNPGIDTALRNLDYEVRNSLKIFQALVQCFEVQIEPLRDWAEGYTLDTVWRNMVTEKGRRQRDRERFEGVAARLLGTRVTVKEAVKNAKALKDACHDKYKLERQIRTAKKAILYANGIIDLVERAASERLACKQLVFELEEASCLLDRKKHPWICKFVSRCCAPLPPSQ